MTFCFGGAGALGAACSGLVLGDMRNVRADLVSAYGGLLSNSEWHRVDHSPTVRSGFGDGAAFAKTFGAGDCAGALQDGRCDTIRAQKSCPEMSYGGSHSDLCFLFFSRCLRRGWI